MTNVLLLHKTAPLVVVTTLRAKGNEPWRLLGPGLFRGHPSRISNLCSSWVQKQYLTQYPGWVVCSLLMHLCTLFFCDSPEWGADKRFLTHSSLSGAKGNSSALSSGPVSSQNFGMARNLWHGREAKLLTSIKTVSVLA